MPIEFLHELILIIIAAFIGGFIARSISLPPVIGYILSGVVFGFLGSNLFTSRNFLLEFSELGVSLLLFTLGFEISLETLKKINIKILVVGVLQLLMTTIFILPFLLFLNFDIATSLFCAILFSFSSTAVIVKILQEKGLLANFPGNNVFIILLLQDLLVIPIIFLIPILFQTDLTSSFELATFLVLTIKSISIFALLLFISKIFLPKILTVLFSYPSHELVLLATLFVASVAIATLTQVGLPVSIAAFLAGILISQEGKNLGPLAEIRPLRDLLLVLFFVMTGMLIAPSYLFSSFPLILFVGVTIVCIKFFVLYIVLRFAGYLPSSAVFVGVYLANVGEFAAVLAQVAFLKGYIDQDIYNFILSVFITSLILLPLTIMLFRKYGLLLGRFRLISRIVEEDAHLFKHDFLTQSQNHVILCGHGKTGEQIRNLLDMAEVPYIVIDFDKKVVTKLTELSKNALYGDPTDDEVLLYANVASAKVLVVALSDEVSQKNVIKTVLEMNPNILILCRVLAESNHKELLASGVHSITIPEFEAGIKIGREVLEIFGIKNDLISSYVAKLHPKNTKGSTS